MLLHDERLRAVDRAEAVLLDRDSDLRRLSSMAARQLDVDIAFLSMVSGSEERLYAVHRDDGGETPTSMPVEQSLCRHLVEADGPLFVRDLHHDPRVSHLAEVRALGLRAYAGMPVRDRSGLVLGGLCVAHGRPRSWRTTDQELLEDLSGVIGTELDLRIALADVERLAAAASSNALEQRTLHEVTAAFAANRPLDDALELLAAGLAGAPDTSCALVVRLHDDGRAEALAAAGAVEDGLARSLPALAEMRGGRPGPARLEHGGTALHAVPVVVEGQLWGALVSEGRLGLDRAPHLQHLADAVALGLSQVRAREDLLHLAATDPLTGAANRRTFEVRLADEVQRSRRHGTR